MKGGESVKKYKCKIPLIIERCDDDGFHVENKYAKVKQGSVWNLNEESFRVIGGEIRLTRRTPKTETWIEISKNSFEKHFEIV